MELNARLKENQDAIQEKLRHLSTTALRIIEEIMIDPESAARDRLAASSKILDLVMRPQPPTDNGLLNQPVSIEIIRATRPRTLTLVNHGVTDRKKHNVQPGTRTVGHRYNAELLLMTSIICWWLMIRPINLNRPSTT